MDVLRGAKKVNREIAMIVMTGYGDIDSTVEAIGIGVDYYLEKPFTFDKLMLCVQDCFEKQDAYGKLQLDRE